MLSRADFPTVTSTPAWTLLSAAAGCHATTDDSTLLSCCLVSCVQICRWSEIVAYKQDKKARVRRQLELQDTAVWRVEVRAASTVKLQSS